MTFFSRLTEALDSWRGSDDEWHQLKPLFDAGKAVVEGEPLWWCEEHDAEATDGADFQPGGQCWKWRFRKSMGLCRMVERRMIDLPGDET